MRIKKGAWIAKHLTLLLIFGIIHNPRVLPQHVCLEDELKYCLLLARRLFSFF